MKDEKDEKTKKFNVHSGFQRNPINIMKTC